MTEKMLKFVKLDQQTPEKREGKERTDDLVNFFETLEEDDDVQNIYSNAKFLK